MYTFIHVDSNRKHWCLQICLAAKWHQCFPVNIYLTAYRGHLCPLYQVWMWFQAATMDPSEQVISRAICLLWSVDSGTAVIICNCKNDIRLIIQPGIKNINKKDSGLLQCDAVSLGEWITMLLRIWEGQTVQELLDPPRWRHHTSLKHWEPLYHS